jgi:hypothetical protein
LVQVIFVLAGPAHAQTAPSQKPGEYPDHLFREPFPRPVDQTGEDFRDNYFFGDWMGARPELAGRGIKPSVLLITDPFVNATGGRRRGFSEYDLLALDLLLDTDKLLGWPGGEFQGGNRAVPNALAAGLNIVFNF